MNCALCEISLQGTSQILPALNYTVYKLAQSNRIKDYNMLCYDNVSSKSEQALLGLAEANRHGGLVDTKLSSNNNFVGSTHEQLRF